MEAGTRPDPASVAPVERMETFSFTGDTGEYFRIWIVNMLLSVATLGIYSAWAKVKNKQYFYRNTRLDGTGFDYHADPMRILKGRLIVGAGFVVLAGSQYYSMALYGVLFGVFMLVMPWLAVKAFTFNARSSSYRNVRFDFTGSVGQSYLAYLVLPAVGLLSFGLLYPVAHRYALQYYARNHRFGKRSFTFRASVGDFYGVYLGMVGVTIGAYLIIMLLIFGFMAAAVDTDAPRTAGASPAVIVPLVLIAYLGMTIPAAFFKARMANLFYGNLMLGKHKMRSVQEFPGILGLYVTNLLALVCTLGLAVPWAKVRLARYRAEHTYVVFEGPFLVEADLSLRRAGAYGEAAADFGDFGFDL